MSESMVAADAPRSYYGRPILKRPEWTWEVPWYLFVGGLAGVSSALSWVAGRAGRSVLQDRTRLVGSVGAVVGPALLISDLGRPQRFLNMLRVFKPTSAMSMGSWILAAYSGAAGGAGVLALAGRFPRLRALADGVAAGLGLPLATYTAVLVADTSIPAWHEARGQLPYVFLGSGVASAGAAAALLTPASEAGPARRLAVGGVLAEVTAAEVMHRRLGVHGSVYRDGEAGRYQRLATGLSAAGAVAVAAGGARRRRLTGLGCALILAGSVSQRWAVYRAGFQSVEDPSFVVGPQRERVDAGGGS